MIANHIHDALDQVKKLQEFILAKRLFRGYSGKARIASGLTAFAGAAVLAGDKVPATPQAHLIGWGIVLAVGVVLNYASLLYWFLFDPEVRRTPVMLKPALDALPALATGAVLTVVFVSTGQYDLLCGTWMCLYGLAQVAYRQSLPSGIYVVGLAYIVCGALCLLPSPLPLVNPWPMGLVFLSGELLGGIVLLSCRCRFGESKDQEMER